MDIVLGDVVHTLTKNQLSELNRRKDSHIPMHSMPKSQVEAFEQKRTYFMGERCRECGTTARWAVNQYCMHCTPQLAISPVIK